MLKISVCVFAIIFSLQQSFACVWTIDESGSGDREVCIRDLTTTVPTRPIPRSSLPTVQAYVDTDFNQLELTFNMEVGVVQLTVLCDGMAVASATCDTSVQDFVCLSVPSAPGFYTIDIVSDQYEGEGEYTLTDI